MVKQSEDKVVSNNSRSPRPIYQPAAGRSLRSLRDNNSVDEIIGALSDSYENKRARQVVEWVRQQGVRRAA
ncbi:MAG: hypothetical protein KF762_10250 [Acidobacteria bacterium]|nr:hypothetical protein [Acidobacteriota bacterium]